MIYIGFIFLVVLITFGIIGVVVPFVMYSLNQKTSNQKDIPSLKKMYWGLQQAINLGIYKYEDTEYFGMVDNNNDVVIQIYNYYKSYFNRLVVK